MMLLRSVVVATLAAAAAAGPSKLTVNLAGTAFDNGEEHPAGPLSRCFDGNHDFANFCHSDGAHTGYTWLRMDLSTSKVITSVKLWNRRDCCGDRITTFDLWVGDEPSTYNAAGNSKCHESYHYMPDTLFNLNDANCVGNGRYVFIVNTDTAITNLNEIEVWGFPEVSDSHYEYLGCYLDSTTRSLTGATYSDSAMTAEFCHDKCQEYDYFGVEYGTQCFCGNDIGIDTRAYNCLMPAAGDTNEVGGGGWALSMYRHITTSSPTPAPTVPAALGFGAPEGTAVIGSTYGVLGNDVYSCTDGVCVRSSSGTRSQLELIDINDHPVGDIAWEPASPFTTPDGSTWTTTLDGLQVVTTAGLAHSFPYNCACAGP